MILRNYLIPLKKRGLLTQFFKEVEIMSTQLLEKRCMSNDIATQQDKATYEKPLFEEQKSLIFPEEIWEEFNKGRFCMSCSSCHACR